jgi:hypothetical protein
VSPLVWEDTVASQTGNTITLTTGLAAWDDTKQYVIIQDDYDVATTTQQTRVYQADDTDGRILDLSSPFQYASGSAESSYEANPSVLPEILPAAIYQDGAGRCAYGDQAIARLADNLIDYKRTVSSPQLWDTVLTNSEYPGNWLLVYCRPVYLSPEVLSGSIIRELNVAPWFRSQIGTYVSVRGTLARTRPTSSTHLNVNRGAVYSEKYWATSSTTWSAGTTNQFDLRVKPVGLYPIAWLLIECGYRAQIRGFSRCEESIRTTEFFGV